MLKVISIKPITRMILVLSFSQKTYSLPLLSLLKATLGSFSAPQMNALKLQIV